MKVALALLLVGVVAGCGSSGPVPPTGAVVFSLHSDPSHWTGVRSIGGYGVFASVDNADGDFVWGQALPFSDGGAPQDRALDLPPGKYAVHILVRPASDAIQNGIREYGPTTAACDADLLIGATDLLRVTVNLASQDACTIEASS